MNEKKIYILQHKKDKGLFVRKLPFGNIIKEIITTRNINVAERFYQSGACIRVYRVLSHEEEYGLKQELKKYKLVEIEVQNVIKGEEIEQVEFIF